jgi:hypothetical protein
MPLADDRRQESELGSGASFAPLLLPFTFQLKAFNFKLVLLFLRAPSRPLW